jgi:two-component system, OmpR family, response regulator
MNGNFVPATPKEGMVLEYLIRHAGRVVTQTQLAQAVWSLDFETGTNVVEVHISRLRKKIDEPGKSSLIKTIPGAGYMVEADGFPGKPMGS